MSEDNKIIFLDVDGTLIDYETKCPATAKEAVKQARENGHKVYLCTGCSEFELSQRDLPETDGLIGGNGSYVKDGDKVLLHQTLTKDQTKKVVDWCEERHLGVILECNSGMYINQWMTINGPKTMKRYALGKGTSEEQAELGGQGFVNAMTLLPLEELYRDDVNKISFILNTYQDHLDSKTEFPDLIANTWGGRGEEALFGDLSPEGITKANAISVLLNALGRDKEDTIAFGDAKIDISMFELCNYGVAMGNGGKEIKEAADYITTDVNDDGLWNAFKYLQLI